MLASALRRIDKATEAVAQSRDIQLGKLAIYASDITHDFARIEGAEISTCTGQCSDALSGYLQETAMRWRLNRAQPNRVLWLCVFLRQVLTNVIHGASHQLRPSAVFGLA